MSRIIYLGKTKHRYSVEAAELGDLCRFVLAMENIHHGRVEDGRKPELYFAVKKMLLPNQVVASTSVQIVTNLSVEQLRSIADGITCRTFNIELVIDDLDPEERKRVNRQERFSFALYQASLEANNAILHRLPGLDEEIRRYVECLENVLKLTKKQAALASV